MIDPAEIEAIIGQYTKHGWALRRVLLCSPSDVASAAGRFGSADVRRSIIDALWFTRRSQADQEAWELRRISGSPFALVAILEDRADETERESIVESVERRMFAARSGPISH